MPVKYTPYELHRLNDGTTCYVSALLKRSRSNLRSLAYKQACRLVSLDYNGGISSFVSSGLPMRTPLALAFAIPDFTRSRIIWDSSSANTPDICINALDIGSSLPCVQSTVILPTITSLIFFSLTSSIISHSCFVLHALYSKIST